MVGPVLEGVVSSVGPGPGNVLPLFARFDAEEGGLWRAFEAWLLFGWALEDCGRAVVFGPGLGAFLGALNVPITGEETRDGEPGPAVVVLFLRWS